MWHNNYWCTTATLILATATGCIISAAKPPNAFDRLSSDQPSKAQRPIAFRQHAFKNDDAGRLATSNGFPVEEHFAITDDDYILRLVRITGPCKNKKAAEAESHPGNPIKPVVFLQHGLLSSSDGWMLNLANESLAFILADSGYDVWMGNVRGNKYSLNNSRLSVNSHEFWQFSFNEMALLDLPAMLNYVAAATGIDQIYYVGMSQGTLLGFIAFSEKPDWAKIRVKQFHALAPIAHLDTMTSALKYVADLTTELDLLFEMVGEDKFLPDTKFVQWVGNETCHPTLLTPLCLDVLFLLVGFDENNINKTRILEYLSHYPAGTSTKNMVHYGQMIYQKKFQKYDYGILGNLYHYHRRRPPVYDLTRFSVPTALYWGDKDKLGDPQDVARLNYEIFDHVIASFKCTGCDHLDFQIGMNAPVVVYPHLLKLLKEEEEERSE